MVICRATTRWLLWVIGRISAEAPILRASCGRYPSAGLQRGRPAAVSESPLQPLPRQYPQDAAACGRATSRCGLGLGLGLGLLHRGRLDPLLRPRRRRRRRRHRRVPGHKRRGPRGNWGVPGHEAPRAGGLHHLGDRRGGRGGRGGVGVLALEVLPLHLLLEVAVVRSRLGLGDWGRYPHGLHQRLRWVLRLGHPRLRVSRILMPHSGRPPNIHRLELPRLGVQVRVQRDPVPEDQGGALADQLRSVDEKGGEAVVGGDKTEPPLLIPVCHGARNVLHLGVGRSPLCGDLLVLVLRLPLSIFIKKELGLHRLESWGPGDGKPPPPWATQTCWGPL
mmetsp:Transcript_86558/g.197560  ORF Transcript_86558/g.197560 Transcript_86558/m.197560 type:complete len:335 (+) Transcript_86558:679-1683(+)